MGIYLVSNAADDWCDEHVLGETANAINDELARRGQQPFTAPPPADFARGSGTMFEEKLYRPMTGFEALCQAHRNEYDCQDALLDWVILLPVPLDEPIVLDIPSTVDDVTTVRSAHAARAAARHLASVIALPLQVPAHCDNLEIGLWFDDHNAVAEAAATHSGLWLADLDTAFYVAMYLRAAEHALLRQCPISYS